MKNRAFIRYTKQGELVPGSLIITGGNFPQGPGTWKEVPVDLCCDNPIALTFDVGSTNLSFISINFFCNGELIKTVYSSQSSSDAAGLQTVLNNMFGLVGTFTVVDTIVTLTMTLTQKNELCQNGKLTFTIFED